MNCRFLLFGWSESTKVRKFGDLCQDGMKRYWENAVAELFPSGVVPDVPGTYDQVFRAWSEKWKGPGQRDAILVHVLTDMCVPEGMTIESYTSDFIRLVQIARRFTGTHSWPGSAQLLGAYFRAVNSAWKALLSMTKIGTNVNFAKIKTFFRSLEMNEEMTGKRIADTLNPSVIKTPKRARHADHHDGDRPKGHSRRWGRNRRSGGDDQGRVHAKRRHNGRKYDN